MPKRKNVEEAEEATGSVYTFRLANGEAFDVQGVKVLVEQLVYKSIDYTNKRLKQQMEEDGVPAEEEGGSSSTITASAAKKEIRRRRRYSREEKSHMIGLYDKYPIKEAAMEVIFAFSKYNFFHLRK